MQNDKLYNHYNNVDQHVVFCTGTRYKVFDLECAQLRYVSFFLPFGQNLPRKSNPTSVYKNTQALEYFSLNTFIVQHYLYDNKTVLYNAAPDVLPTRS